MKHQGFKAADVIAPQMYLWSTMLNLILHLYLQVIYLVTVVNMVALMSSSLKAFVFGQSTIAESK